MNRCFICFASAIVAKERVDGTALAETLKPDLILLDDGSGS